MAFEWKTDVNNDGLKDHTQNVRLIFEEAKTRLQATVDSYNIVLAKANGLLGFVIALSTGLCAFLLGKQMSAFVAVLLGVYLVCAIVAGYHALKVLWKREMHVDGFMPDRLFQKEWVTQEPTKLQAQLIELYAEKIAFNQELVKGLIRHVKRGTVWFLVGSSVFTFGYLSAAAGLKTVLFWAASVVHL